MSNRLYVGNMSYHTNEEKLRKLFGEVGEVRDVVFSENPDTDESLGAAFVTMASDEDAARALEQLKYRALDGRTLTINEALDR